MDEDAVSRLKALDHVSDFKMLEEFFVADDDLRIKGKALDRILELYSERKRTKKMLELSAQMFGIFGWIPIDYRELHKRSKIDNMIKWIMDKTKEIRKSDMAHVILIPTGESRVTYVGEWRRIIVEQYKFLLIVRLLVFPEYETEMQQYYYGLESWNSNPEAHVKKFNKYCYQQIPVKKNNQEEPKEDLKEKIIKKMLNN